MQNAILIPFHGDDLYLIEHLGEPYTPMKPIVEAMGLDWKTQHRKFSSDIDRWGMVIMTIQLPGDIQRRDVLLLPIRKLFGWMMTISPNRVKPEIREKVIQYQNECDDILWNYWTQQKTRGADSHFERLWQSSNSKEVDKIISIHRLEEICEHRRAAAACLYFFLQNEQSDLSDDGWFKMSYRDLEQYLDFTFSAIGTALRYLYKSGLVYRDSGPGRCFPFYFKINHKILAQKIRQCHLPILN